MAVDFGFTLGHSITECQNVVQQKAVVRPTRLFMPDIPMFQYKGGFWIYPQPFHHRMTELCWTILVIKIKTITLRFMQMKNSTTWVLVLSLCSFNAASAMRCGHKLVELGDYKGDVLARCGEPESVETRTKIVSSTLHHPHRTLDLQQYEEVQIEEWVYNFGSSRLQQYLRFENGELKEIKSLGRGH